MELQRVLNLPHRSLQGFKACLDVSLIFYTDVKLLTEYRGGSAYPAEAASAEGLGAPCWLIFRTFFAFLAFVVASLGHLRLKWRSETIFFDF